MEYVSWSPLNSNSISSFSFQFSQDAFKDKDNRWDFASHRSFQQPNDEPIVASIEPHDTVPNTHEFGIAHNRSPSPLRSISPRNRSHSPNNRLRSSGETVDASIRASIDI